jgi:hypothetical protein
VDRLRYEFMLNNVMFAFAPRSKVILEEGKTYGEYFPEAANARKSDSRYVDITAFDLYLEDDPLFLKTARQLWLCRQLKNSIKL